jgi:uncharacterized protein (TIGR04255 family)
VQGTVRTGAPRLSPGSGGRQLWFACGLLIVRLALNDMKGRAIEYREIYASAPLRFVAFEMRFRPTPTAEPSVLRDRLFKRVREHFPISEPTPPGTEVVIGPQGPQVTSSAGLRTIDRDRTRSLTVTSQAIAVETSAYTRFGELRNWIEEGLRALAELDYVAAVERVGLRYIDEIRIAGVETPEQFAPYVVSALHGPWNLIPGARVTTTQGQTEFELGARRWLTMRYGALSGWAVDPGGPLRLPSAPDGPFFLIDLDSYWIRPEEAYPAFDVDEMLDLVEVLHQPTREAFEAAITDRLRKEVLRREVV